MKRFACDCGQPVFFENDSCVHCGSTLGIDSSSLSMKTLTQTQQGLLDEAGQLRRYCKNHQTHGVCNWLCDINSDSELCFGCSFNRFIPNLDKIENVQRWQRLEVAKKRILFSLKSLGLPLLSGHVRTSGLLFDFLEDGQSDSLQYGDLVVNTGHLNGVITINVLEAEDVAREAQRAAMNESYRTLLGHMRHESGHYYQQQVVATFDAQELEDMRNLFGDEREDYGAALARYYEVGPSIDATQHHVSAYASSHPQEDWAESWAHYLHITDAIETAASHGIIPVPSNFRSRMDTWRGLSVTLNELNRSVGLHDAFPFVVTAPVEAKLAFIGKAINRLGLAS